MPNRTPNNLNPTRKPNAAKYRSLAARPDTWARMVNSTRFDAEGGCWEWLSTINETGYGLYCHHEMGNVFAHRLALHVAGRPVPADRVVDHLCRNRRCVNPAHLEIVPGAENILRGEGAAAINARKTHCIHGHEFTPENTTVRLVRRKNRATGWTRVCKACVRSRQQRKAA